MKEKLLNLTFDGFFHWKYHSFLKTETKFIRIEYGYLQFHVHANSYIKLAQTKIHILIQFSQPHLIYLYYVMLY